MSVIKNEPDKVSRKIAFRGGSYAIVISAIVLAILIAVNILANVLPATLTKQDISAASLYSITSNTKVVVGSLEKDVTIYWIVQADQEDGVIENLLAKYDSLSSHITVTKMNPDVYPTFASQYTDGTVTNNSLVVECGDKYRYISYNEIYLTEVDYTTYSYVYSFDGEGAITSAIDYVVSDELPLIYLLEGHGEESLPSEFANQIEKDNMETASLSLLTEDEIPEDADCIMIFAPSTDISEEERDQLLEYVSNGGKLMVIAGPSHDDELENLYSILAEYDVSYSEGIVIESSTEHYAFYWPYMLIPEIESNTITDPIIDAGYYIILPIARGLTKGSNSLGTTKELLLSSDDSFSKIAGYDLDTYEKEEDDIDGPFALAVDVLDYTADGEIVWIASSRFLDADYNAYSSGANLDFAMNSLAELIGESEAMSIRVRSLGYNYLTITSAEASRLKAVMIGIIPLAFVAAGIIVTVVRRRKKNEQI